MDSLYPKTIKQLLKKKNYTQELLARHIDVSHNTVNRWVTGQKKPSLDNYCQMATCLQVSLKRLASLFEIDVQNIPDDIYSD